MLTKNEKEDYRRYYVDKPTNYNPLKDKATVEECIKRTDMKRQLQSDKYTEAIRERVDAAVSYLIYAKQKSTSIENYFGRQFLGYLQGQRIVQKLKRLRDGRKVLTLEEVT